SGTAVPVDFALVCATHCQLLEAAAQGRFRQDLYYRINGLTVQLPALRERSDFAALTQRLLLDFYPERALQLAPELHARLAGYAWPGNLRQVASVLRTACAMLDDDEDTLDLAHMPDDLIAALSIPLKNAVAAPCPADPVPAPHATLNLQELSHAAIQQALQSTRGNVTQAARQLGISRQTIYRKLEAATSAQRSA
ncbi:MAG: helix-turn-helix domain-containing protein, partial [Giesbergeria sp.]